MSGERIKSKSSELTRAELEIMQILWNRGPSLVHDVLAEIPEPKPAYNTVLTFLRILKEKQYVASEAVGKQHRFYPLVQHSEYSSRFLQNVKNNLFRGSATDLVNFFVKEENLSAKEIEELIELLKKGGLPPAPPKEG